MRDSTGAVYLHVESQFLVPEVALEQKLGGRCENENAIENIKA